VTGSYLLDTNAWIRLLRNDSQIEQRPQSSGAYYLCTHALGELYTGVLKSAQVHKNTQDVDDLLKIATLLLCDQNTAREFAKLRHFLRVNGTPIPINDVGIAATSLQYGLTLATDDAHFDAIPHLTKERW
jgi:predicted nucleic acid-binding protein